MSDGAIGVLERMEREGPRQHARWEPALYHAFCAGPAAALWDAIGAQPGAEPAFEAYLRLAVEALGEGYIDRADLAPAPGPRSLLALLWVRLIPHALARVPPAARLEALARLWNLGEGLMREPVWLNRYVAGAAAGLEDLGDVEDFLVRVLEPALTPSEPSAWQGPFAVTVLDARPLADEFLPGELHMAAPAVLCVHDRRTPGVHAGVFLRRGGQSRFMGLTPCLGELRAESGLAGTVFEDGVVRIRGRPVALPHLRRCHRHAVAEAGFLVAAAVDSQRLWVVESAS